MRNEKFLERFIIKVISTDGSDPNEMLSHKLMHTSMISSTMWILSLILCFGISRYVYFYSNCQIIDQTKVVTGAQDLERKGRKRVKTEVNDIETCKFQLSDERIAVF